MKKVIKKIVVIGLIILVLIQFYQPDRNLDYGPVLPEHFFKMYPVPENVQTILKTCCFDCHSNSTTYPWYSHLQPVRFLMDSHINEGKQNLNFSEFGKYSKRKQNSKLDAIKKQIKSDKMPLTSYTLIHKKAVLSVEQKETVIKWLNTINNLKNQTK